jgi:hypothetical protein
MEVLYKKTACQFQIKFITQDFLEMYRTLQPNTITFTIYTSKFTSIKVIKTHMYGHKVIKNTKLIKARIKLKLIIVLGLMK